MTLNTRSFRTEVREGVAVITLSRPESINSLTFEIYAELRDTFRAMKEGHAEVRAVVLQGEGPRGFCSGGDQHDIISELFSRDMQGLLEFTRMTGALVQAIKTTRPPVICALHRVVCGAGAVIATACDIRLAAPNTKIGFIFPQVGLCGADMGAAYLLPRLVGVGRATEILLTGDWVLADRAEQIGLVTRVVDVPGVSDDPRDRGAQNAQAVAVRQAAFEFARHLAAGPAFAHAMTKRMIEYEGHVDFATGIEAEAQAQAICMQHPDFLEAHEAWKAKRAPKFK